MLFGQGPLRFDLVGPARDEGGVGAGFEGGAVAGQALIAFGEAASGGSGFRVLGGVGGGGLGESLQGVGQAGGAKIWASQVSMGSRRWASRR